MSIEFSTAKNGEKTCSVDGKFYHSRYNPLVECERWIDEIQVQYKPEIVLVLGPGLPYCLNPLQKKFPESRIILIQYDKDFINNQIKNEQILVDNYETAEQLSEYFFSSYGEELSNRIFIISWKPSENIYPEKFKFTTKAIEIYLKKSQNIIATRRYFSKKWFKNSIRFLSNVKKLGTIKPGNKDIIIAASGPSLKEGLPFLIKYRKDFYLIAVSSAIFPLIHNNIIPDIVISTDGGFWAKKHLEILLNSNKMIPIISSLESALPYQLIYNEVFIPINYGDYINNTFFNITGIKGISTSRNGTVSGNAVEIALTLTKGKVYTVGIDLEYTSGFQHTQPNKLEIADSLEDNRIHNAESRIMKRNLNTTSLKIYKAWFENLPLEKTQRLNRLFKNTHPPMGRIESIRWKDVRFNSQNKNNLQSLTEPEIIKQNIKNPKSVLKEYFNYLIIFFETKDIDLILKNHYTLLKELSLGNILNYEKFNNKKFLLLAVEETLDCLKSVGESLR